MKVELAFKVEPELGEGPVWSEQEQRLFFVDILGRRIHAWKPENDAHETWDLPSEVGCLALKQSGGAIVALQDGFYDLDLASGVVKSIHLPPDEPGGNRFNDGKCDRNGRFWAGSMNFAMTKSSGSLYCYEADGNCRVVREGIGISNGLGWSPDNRTFYFTDSVTRTLYSFDFDPYNGAVSNERVFAKENAGEPDGLTVDSEGCIWSAVWDGHKVVRYRPDGTVADEIPIPVPRPTSCMFGGPDLKTLYITSARTGLSAEQLRLYPDSGSIFAIQSDVAGLPEPLFAG